MASQAEPRRWTFEEYFAWEELQPERHEFIDGEIVAMSGGTHRHACVIRNLGGLLFNALRDRRCQPYTGVIKLFVAAANRSYYPDGLVNCAPENIEERGVVHDATAVFEVLSPSTAANDKGEKLEDYQTLPSLRHYALIDPNALTVEIFDRTATGWSFRKLRVGAILTLDALDIELNLNELFENVGDAVAPIGRPTGLRDEDLEWPASAQSQY